MMSKRTWIRAVAVLGVAVIAVAGCSSRGDSGGAPAPDAQAVTQAEDMLLAASQTMFTWYPTEDASPADAYQRAVPLLRRDMRASFNSVTDGAAAMWPQWRKQRVTLTATSQFAAGTVPVDTSGQIERPVVVTQTEMSPTGNVAATREFKLERVVAKKSNDAWQVEEINFFPVNPFRTALCPPGSAHSPAPDGPCQPVAAPPTKACPDGTSVPADRMCPAQRNQPQTKKCPDGTTVPVNSACANEATQVKQCPDGSTVSVNDQCQATEPEPCPEGQTRDANGQCVSTAVECPSGSTLDPATGQCVQNACANGQTRDGNGVCQSPVVSCPDGSTVPAGADCPVIEEQNPVSCIDGSTVPAGTDCPADARVAPCAYTGQYRDTADGLCKCGAGRSAEPDGSCGPYVGAPAPGLPGVTSPPRRSMSFRRPPGRRRLGGLQCCHAGRSPASIRRRR
jgi:hypothetical protein